MPWPWRRKQTEAQPVAAPERDEVFEHEKRTLEAEIEQISKVNEWVLNRALAKRRITPEEAEAIRTTQVYRTQVLRFDLDKPSEPSEGEHQESAGGSDA